MPCPCNGEFGKLWHRLAEYPLCDRLKKPRVRKPRARIEAGSIVLRRLDEERNGEIKKTLYPLSGPPIIWREGTSIYVPEIDPL